MRAVAFAWGPVALWVAVLFLLSSSSGLSGPNLFAHEDKVAHLGLYALLGAVFAHARGVSQARGLWAPPAVSLIVLAALIGVLDEWVQSTVPGRTPSAADWAADVAGILLGFAMLTLLRSILVRRAPHV